MALKAGYVGVKRWLYEKLQATTAKNVQDIADIWASDALTGAKNLVDVSGTVGDHSKASVTSITSKGFTLSTIESAANVASKTPLNLVNGADYTVSLKVTALTGTGKRIAIRSSSQSIVAYKDVTATGDYTFNFTYTTGDKLAVFVTGSTAAEGSITVDDVMIRPAADPDATYAPYAMTNQQLTTKSRLADFTFAEGVEAADTGQVEFTQIGDIVVVNMIVKGLVANSATWAVVGDVPADLKPAGFRCGMAVKSAGANVFNCSVSTDGKVRVRNQEAAIIATDSIMIQAVYSTLAQPAAAAANREVEDTMTLEDVEDPEPVTKTTRSTKKTATNKEGE